MRGRVGPAVATLLLLPGPLRAQVNAPACGGAGTSCAAFPAGEEPPRPPSLPPAPPPAVSAPLPHGWLPPNRPCPPAPQPPRPCPCIEPTPSGLSVLVTVTSVPAWFGIGVELAVADHVGLSGALGYGTSTTTLDRNPSRAYTAHLFRLWSDLVYYPFGAFDDFGLGVEVGYGAAFGNREATDVEPLGRGLAIGALAGYKAVSTSGFTFLVQLAPGVRIPVDSFEGDRSESEFLARLGLGKTF